MIQIQRIASIQRGMLVIILFLVKCRRALLVCGLLRRWLELLLIWGGSSVRWRRRIRNLLNWGLLFWWWWVELGVDRLCWRRRGRGRTITLLGYMQDELCTSQDVSRKMLASVSSTRWGCLILAYIRRICSSWRCLA
jgi:hypothetical protein